MHLPEILNSCTDPDGCTLNTITVTQGAYHTGQDLEIWKKHFDVPGLDSGFLPITAYELKTKMNSRENIYYTAGDEDSRGQFEELDGTEELCGTINQKALDYAYAQAGSTTLTRFEGHGQPYVIGKDIPVCAAGKHRRSMCFIDRTLC